MFEQPNGSSTVQSYFAQCGQSKVKYEKRPQIPSHIEEALEEVFSDLIFYPIMAQVQFGANF
jgi:hypothetical protein